MASSLFSFIYGVPPKRQQHQDDDDDEDDQEMVGLLANSDYSAPPNEILKTSRKKKKSKRLCTDMKPLEVMHASVERRFASKSSTLACRAGLSVFILSIILGICIWISQHYEIDSRIKNEKNYNHSSKIKYWCLDKSNACTCPDPLEPRDRIGHKTWKEAHDGNVREALTSDNVDVVFFGDSIIEGWRGMSLGQLVPEKKPNIKVFNSLFEERQGAAFQGLALGLAGDKTYNLLWRIQNGELRESLQPSVWWILIGTNDFLMPLPHCSSEVVLLGIKNVVEEVLKLRPGSIIVLNSLLPRSEPDLRGRLVDANNTSRKTLWQGILEVNRGLRDFSSKARNVIFFDATSIFVSQDKNTKGIDGMYIPVDLMYDYLHPTSLGYKRWGDEIVKTLHHVIDASLSEQGRRPITSDKSRDSQSKSKRKNSDNSN